MVTREIPIPGWRDLSIAGKAFNKRKAAAGPNEECLIRRTTSRPKINGEPIAKHEARNIRGDSD